MSEHLPFALLRPVQLAPPSVNQERLIVGANPHDIDWLLQCLDGAELVAIDVETRGTDTWKPETAIVGVGFAWRRGQQLEDIYFDIQSAVPQAVDELFIRIAEWSVRFAADGGHLVNHNVMFDQAMWRMELFRRGVDARIEYTHCTYGLYKSLAGEGWPGQRWNLKLATVQLLGWPEKHDVAVDEWLIANGYHKAGPKRREGESPAEHLARCREWQAVQTPGKRARPVIKAKKGEMWRVPVDILGKYCALDCHAVLQLYDYVLRPVLDRFPEIEQFHRGAWMHQTHLLADQQRGGIRVDRPRLEAHRDHLQSELVRLEAEMRASEVLGPAIRNIEGMRWFEECSALRAKPIEQYRTVREAKEPPRLTKKGEVSAAWTKWDAKRRAAPIETAAWVRREAALAALATTGQPTDKWSPSSPADIRSLLFESDLVHTEQASDSTYWMDGVNGRVELDLTKDGKMSVDVKALSQLPEWGVPVAKYRKLDKELSYVVSYLDLLYWHADPNGPDTRVFDTGEQQRGTWRLHPGWIMDGTKTLRLASVRPNCTQIPKSLELMECFVADEGTVWLEFDWRSLEPTVLSELSRDAGLMSLFGPDAKPHDRYLFSAASYPGKVGEGVRAIYDVENPTAESVAAAKKECKAAREIGKVMCIAEGELVCVAERGWVPIESVLRGDRVWDGEDWVECDGAVYNGTSPVTELDGVRLTQEHKVLTNEGWEVSERAARAQLVRPIEPSSSWTDVWKLVRAFVRDATSGWVSVRASELPSPRRRVDVLR